MTALRKLSSTAVMARRTEAADSLDFFPTPPWATRAAIEHCLPIVWDAFGPASEPKAMLKGGPRAMSAYDPAAGMGHMAGVLAEYFDTVHRADIADYPVLFGPNRRADFLDLAQPHPVADWIFINPPFVRAEDFILRARALAGVGVAVLARAQFLEGLTRYREIFRDFPPHWICHFVERVPMLKGRWAVNARTASAYCWLFWLRHPSHAATRIGPRVLWIPPSKRALTRPDDAVRFGGCSDLPAKHPVTLALKRQAAGKGRGENHDTRRAGAA